MVESKLAKFFKNMPLVMEDDCEELDTIFVFLTAFSSQVEAKRVLVRSKLSSLEERKELSLDKLGVSIYDVIVGLKSQQYFLDRLGSLLRSIVNLGKSWSKQRERG